MAIASIQGQNRMSGEASTLNINGRDCTLIRYLYETEHLSWRQIAQQLVDSSPFRNLWNQTLATPNSLASKLEDYQWKPIPIHPCSLELPFFAVLVPTNFATANPRAYQSHFAALTPNRQVAVFPNLSGTSTLVSPASCRQPHARQFGHLAEFCRTAPSDLVDEFWHCMGTLALEQSQSEQPVWCNTHGHGVPWLHVRFDPNHKYASFPPYGAISPDSQLQWYALYERAFGDSITLGYL